MDNSKELSENQPFASPFMKTTTSSKLRWFSQAVLGLLLSGAGLSMCIDAGFVKFQGGDWFWYGTGALVVFQAGLCVLIDSSRFRTL